RMCAFHRADDEPSPVERPNDQVQQRGRLERSHAAKSRIARGAGRVSNAAYHELSARLPHQRPGVEGRNRAVLRWRTPPAGVGGGSPGPNALGASRSATPASGPHAYARLPKYDYHPSSQGGTPNGFEPGTPSATNLVFLCPDNPCGRGLVRGNRSAQRPSSE